MKKLFPVLLLALCLIVLVCAACGRGTTESVQVSSTMEPTPTPSPTPDVTPTPEPTEEPEETAEPEESAEPEDADEPAETAGSDANANNGGNPNNSNAGGNTATAATHTPEPTAEPDKRSVAEGMVGRSTGDLYAAIGQPNATQYLASCLVFGAEDGLLYYDGFTVDTVRYSDGTEMITGVWDD